MTQQLWDRFQAVDSGQDVQRCAMTQQAFADLRVMDGQGKPWVLRAQPILDAAGRFSGYLGAAAPGHGAQDRRFAAPSSEGDALGPDGPTDTAPAPSPSPGSAPCARAEWLQALPGPAWLISGGRPGPQTQLVDCNLSAAQLMGGGDFAGQLWRACEERLPEDFRQALAQPELHSGSACGAWWLCLTPLPGGECSLLSLWPQGAADTVPAALAMQAAEQARADQASFSYTVSHDLRAPLRVVEGFTRILKEDYGRLLDRAGNDHLDRVLGASARMHTMIDALLALSQLSSQSLRQEPVDLSLLAQQVLEDLRRAAPQRAVQVQVQEGLWAHGDPTLLRMVLENLLGNAWKYSGQREVAVIRFEAAPQAPPGQRGFVVIDNGAGFDMRFADRLFGVFQRLHSASEFPGTGVGLASARRIVRRHGGDMWAESEAGEGARFYFSLPA